MLRVAYQGAPGAFSESAIAVFWDVETLVTPVPLADFEGAVEAVHLGAVDAAVLPVENTRMGIIQDCVGALLRRNGLRALWETDMSVRHQLLALPGASLGTLCRVESHPAALAQCQDWLARHPHLRVVVASDTAAAARDVAASRDWTRAAIASAAAGMRYGLSVLERDLQDDPQNRTRFWAVARGPWQDVADVVASGAGSERVRDLRGMPIDAAVIQLRTEAARREEAVALGDALAGARSGGDAA
jgi:prephenate dehydratase